MGLRAADALGRSTNGRPYEYGGDGDGPYGGNSGDCSWAVYAMAAALQNKSVTRRYGSTETFRLTGDSDPKLGLVRCNRKEDVPADAIFKLGMYHNGGGVNSHTWCTVNGVNYESRGMYQGRAGVIYGPQARAWDDKLGNQWGYLPNDRIVPDGTPDAPGQQVETIYGIDISNHQGNERAGTVMDLARVAAEGFQAVICKASEGNYYTDWTFPRFRDAARANGLLFVGYHYARAGDPVGNARQWHKVVNDTSVPCMIDFEQGSGTIADYWAVRREIEKLGYRVTLSYIPDWYHAGAMGGGDLSNVGPIMSSQYASADGYASAIYAGHTPDWSNYGGGKTTVLQFTDKAQVAGLRVDAWAYVGTRASLSALLTGTVQEDDDMPYTEAQLKKFARDGVWEWFHAAEYKSRVDGSDVTFSLADALLDTNAAAWSMFNKAAPAITAAVSELAKANGSSLTPEEIQSAVEAGMTKVVQVQVSVEAPKASA